MFVPEAAIEALNKTVLHRRARRDAMPVDSRLLAPSEHRHTGQFRLVVADKCSGSLASGHDRGQFPRDTQPRERGVGDQGEALPAEVVDDGQDTEPAPVGEGVRDEIRGSSVRWASLEQTSV